VPASVVYRLTPYGLTVLPVVESVRVWDEAHLRRTLLEPLPDKAIRCGVAVE
jgi:DNA-binding HxlR family transcriptional regulator